MSYQLYVAEWNSNGTNDLIIVDQDSQIIAVLPEALFGVRVEPDRRIGQQLVAIDDAIIMVEDDSIEAFGCKLLTSIPVESALRRIAVSPTCDGTEAVDLIRQYFPDGE